MKKIILPFAAALTLVSANTSAPLAAQSPEDLKANLSDLMCFVAASQLSDMVAEETPDEEDFFMIVAVYNIGKIHGRDPNFDLAKAFEQYSAVLDTIDPTTEMTRCLADFAKVGEELSQIGM